MWKSKYLFWIFQSLLLLLLLIPSVYSNEGPEDLLFNQIKHHVLLRQSKPSVTEQIKSVLEDDRIIKATHRVPLPSSSISPSRSSNVEDDTTSLNRNFRKWPKAVDSHSRVGGVRLIQDENLKKFYESLATLDNHQADIALASYDPDIFTDTDEIVNLTNINSGYNQNLSDSSSFPSDIARPGDTTQSKFPPGPLNKQPGVAEWIKSSVQHLSYLEKSFNPSVHKLDNLTKPHFIGIKFQNPEFHEDSNTDTVNILITENEKDPPENKTSAMLLHTSNSSLDDIHKLQQTVNSAVSATLNENEVFQEALAQIIAVPGKTPIVSVVNSTIPDLEKLEATLKKLLGSEIIFKETQNKSLASGIIPLQGESIISNFLNKTVGVDNLGLNTTSGRINIVNIFIINIHKNKNILYNFDKPINATNKEKYNSDESHHFIPIYENNPPKKSFAISSNYQNVPEKFSLFPDADVYDSVDGTESQSLQKPYGMSINSHRPEEIGSFYSRPYLSNYEGTPIHEEKFHSFDNSHVTPNEFLSNYPQNYEGQNPFVPSGENIEADEIMQENLDTLHHILAKLQTLSTSDQVSLPSDTEFSGTSSPSYQPNMKQNDRNNQLSNTKGLNLNDNTVLDLLPSFVKATTIAPIIPLNNASMYEDIGRKPSVLGLLPNQLFAITNPKFHLRDNSTSGGIIRKDLQKSKTNDNFSGRFDNQFMEKEQVKSSNSNSQFGSTRKSNGENFDIKNNVDMKEKPLSQLFNPPPKLFSSSPTLFSSPSHREEDDRPSSLSPPLKDIHPIKLLELLTLLSNNKVKNEELKQNTNAKELPPMPMPSDNNKPKTLEKLLAGISIDGIKRAITIGAIPSGLAFASALFPYWSPLVFGKKRRKRDANTFPEEEELANFYPHFNNNFLNLGKEEAETSTDRNVQSAVDSGNLPTSSGRKIPGSNVDREILMTFVDSVLDILHRDSKPKKELPKEKFADDFSKADYLNNRDIDNELSNFESSNSLSSSFPYYSLESATGKEIHQPD